MERRVEFRRGYLSGLNRWVGFGKVIYRGENDAHAVLALGAAEAFEAKVKHMLIWEDIAPKEKGFWSSWFEGLLATNPTTAPGYWTFKGAQWVYDRAMEHFSEEVPLKPFPANQPIVYHFHPVAFVEEMKRMGDNWHDPIKNPQLNKYTFSGNENPVNASFGFVRSGSLHSGIDIFALPGTPVYACMDGVVVAPKEIDNEGKGKAGKTIRIKVDNTDDFIKRLSAVNYPLQFKDRGEEIGCKVKSADDIYLIYMHMSEYRVKKGDAVIKGDLIGFSGMTGNADGSRAPHLHFEITTVLDGYGHGISPRINPARVVELCSYDTKEQDESKDYKYKKDGTKEKC